MRKMEFDEANEIAERALNGSFEDIEKARAHFDIHVYISWCSNCIHAKECKAKKAIRLPYYGGVSHCRFYKYEGDDNES